MTGAGQHRCVFDEDHVSCPSIYLAINICLFFKDFTLVSFCTLVPTTEPDGMSAPEVVPVNSSTVRVLWFPPLQPNGAITGYCIYVNEHLHGSVDNSSGSYLLGDLLPFTIYNVQVQKLKDRHANSNTDTQTCTWHFYLLCLCISGGGVYCVCMCQE